MTIKCHFRWDKGDATFLTGGAGGQVWQVSAAQCCILPEAGSTFLCILQPPCVSASAGYQDFVHQKVGLLMAKMTV